MIEQINKKKKKKIKGKQNKTKHKYEPSREVTLPGGLLAPFFVLSSVFFPSLASIAVLGCQGQSDCKFGI